MAWRLLALTLALVLVAGSGAAWRSWTLRDAIFLTPDAAALRVVVIRPGVRLISYRAAEGWRAVVGQQLAERGWYTQASLTPASQHTYYRITYLWLGHLSELAALRGGAEQAEITLRWSFVWRWQSIVPLSGSAPLLAC